MKELFASGEWSPSHGSPSEETRQKISNKLMGKPKPNTENYKGKPKNYLITMYDGSEVEINNLKKYGIDNKIPYVTLFKAAQHSTKIPKYNIQAISVCQ